MNSELDHFESPPPQLFRSGHRPAGWNGGQHSRSKRERVMKIRTCLFPSAAVLLPDIHKMDAGNRYSC